MKLLFDDSGDGNIFKIVPETDFDNSWIEQNLPNLTFLRVSSSEYDVDGTSVHVQALSNADVFAIADDLRSRGKSNECTVIIEDGYLKGENEDE